MKKILFFLTLFVTLMWGGKLPVIVSIVPEKTFVEAIGGDQVDVTVMVPPGSSPHTYEPKPSQMKAIAKAKLYLAVGVEFESVWLPRFRDLNPAMQIVDISEGITRRPMREKRAAKSHALDPHVWTAPANVAIWVRNITRALQQADPAHRDLYAANAEKVQAMIAQTDAKLHTLLDPLRGAKFMVQHPSWGYFADAYGLEQLPIQIAGKSPKPRELVALVRLARKEKIRAVFVQPEASDLFAKILGRELNIPVVRISPMAPDWTDNLLRLAQAIAGTTERP